MENNNSEMNHIMSAMKTADTNTRAYFESLMVEQRIIGSVLPQTEMKLWGETFATPIMMAALSHLTYDRNGTKANGMVEMAQGAFEANAVNWVGMDDNEELGRILATGAKTIKIMKPYANEDEIYSRIEFCEKNNAFAVGMDVDHAIGAKGENMSVLGQPMEQKSIEQLKKYVCATKLPFVIKGVLSVQDAMRSVEIGAKAIVVSHHHGMCPYAVPPLMVLPDIKKAVGDKVEIFVDCNIINGMDAFKALALGADAVSVGRAIMPSLKENGAQGVVDSVEQMTNELKVMMARTDSPNITKIDPSVIWHAKG